MEAVKRYMSLLTSPLVLWKQVWGLAAVQGAISLTWLLYRLYLPQLLMQFGLSPGLERPLLIVEDVIATAIEPVMGGMSDRAQYWLGSRFPLISMGVIAAASLFISIPAIVLLGQPSQFLQVMLLIVLVGWALAMASFRSPVMCLLGIYATVPNLPQAASVLTLMGSLVGALRPLASSLILGLGPALTFTIGSVSLLAASAVLRAIHPPFAMTPRENLPSSLRSLPSPMPWSQLILLALAGLGASWGVRLLLGEIFPRLLTIGVPNVNLSILMGLLSIALGILAIPLGIAATRWGNCRLMLASIVTIIASLGITLMNQQPIVVVLEVIALVVATSTVLNGVIPLALSVMPPERGGLGIGCYFGGFTAGMALFNAVIVKSGDLAFDIVARLAIVAFAIAGLGILFVGDDRSQHSTAQPPV